MKKILDQISLLRTNLNSLRPLSIENQQKLDKKLRLEWNFNSNHIEGNTLTYGETELLLIFDQTKGNHEMREYEEMKGHDVALKLVYDLAADKERTLTEKFIRELNEIILVRPFYKEAITFDGQDTRRLIKIGEYKSEPNSVRLSTGEIFHYPSPQETPALMNDLMQWYNEVSTTENPVEIAALLHYKFVCIHPFDDGNGRIARLLMNYHLIKNGYPPVIIKTEDKKNYIFALREADAGNVDAFNGYIANQLVWSYEISIKAAKGESIDEAGDWEKKVEVLKRDLVVKPEASKVKSTLAITEIYINSFIPLVHEVLSKIKPLEELYYKTRIDLNIRGYNNSIRNLSSDNTSELPHFELDDDIYTIEVRQNLYNFKKNGTNIFNSQYTITFNFNDLVYEVLLNGDDIKKLVKLNNDYLTPREIEEMSNKISNGVYEQIKRNIKSN